MTSTLEEVMAKKDKKNLRAELKEKGVKLQNFFTHEKLAELYIESETSAYASDKKEDNFEEWAEEVRNISKTVKKGSVSKSVAFISKNFNYRLSPVGSSKEGKQMRYVSGYSSLNIEDQRKQGDVFPVEHILFRGIEGTTWDLDDFKGKGYLSTSDEALKKYLIDHERFGSDYIIFDTQKKVQQKIIDDKKITKLKYSAYNGSKNDLIRVVSYLDMKSGKDSFKLLNAITDENVLIQNALNYIENSPDTYLDAMSNKFSKIIHLVNLSEFKGVLKVSSDGRNVSLAENGKAVASSSLTSDWQSDVADYLLTAEGQPLLDKLELRCGYTVR